MSFPSKAEIQRGKELAKQGTNHLAFVKTLDKVERQLEFDVPDGSSEEYIKEAGDSEEFKMIMEELKAHKKECPGCTNELMTKVKAEVAALRPRRRLFWPKKAAPPVQG